MYMFRICGLPAVTHNLVAMCWVSLHITGDRQGVGHQSHSVAKIFICRIQLELSLLGKTWGKKTPKLIFNYNHNALMNNSQSCLFIKKTTTLLPFKNLFKQLVLVLFFGYELTATLMCWLVTQFLTFSKNGNSCSSVAASSTGPNVVNPLCTWNIYLKKQTNKKS